MDLASECDADFIKFQTHLAEAETLINAPMPSYFKGEPRYEYFKRTEFSVEQWRKLKKCDEAGVGFYLHRSPLKQWIWRDYRNKRIQNSVW